MSPAESPALDRSFAEEIVKKLRAAGFEALWAGGCVRDMLMGNVPEDYDVATSAEPQQVRALFGQRQTIAVGAAFGVIVVLDPRRQAQQVEVATFRTESGYSDGRRPDRVQFSTAEEDAQRRDFTINGMFLDPLKDEVIDYVGGQRDLQQGLIRAIGDADARIAEDKLRMLRAIRFAARFAFRLEAQTAAALRVHAPEISLVSGERIAAELQKTLVTPAAGWAMAELFQAGFLDVLLPQVASRLRDHPARLARITATLDALPLDWRLRIASLSWVAFGLDACATTPLPMLGELKALVHETAQLLKLSRDDATAWLAVLALQPAFEKAASSRWSELQPHLLQPQAELAIALLRQRAQWLPRTDGDHLTLQADQLSKKLLLPPSQLDPPPLLLGSDLIAAGMKPGPRFKELLSQVRAWQLDQIVTTKQEAWSRLQQKLL